MNILGGGDDHADYQKNGGAEYFGTKIAYQVATKRG